MDYEYNVKKTLKGLVDPVSDSDLQENLIIFPCVIQPFKRILSKSFRNF